jgi:hypothetical protein
MGRERWKYVIWAAIFVVGSLFMVVQVGFWDHVNHVNLEDVNAYKGWSDIIVATHALPLENTWQYPPGAAFLMLIPRIGGDYGRSFVILMLLFDLAGLFALVRLAKREGRDAGVWVWLFTMPLLFTLPVLRFDLVPTVCAVAALTVIHRRPRWFGALVGIGAMVKVWPILLLFGEWDRRRLLRAILVLVAVSAAVFAVAAALWGKQTGFISNQDARGLQVEAVAATPWALREVVTGEVPDVVQRFGTNEIGSGPAETISSALTVVTLLLLIAAAGWWVLREREIRAGRDELTDDAVSRDFIFTVVLWFVVISRVFSPQYMIWLIGLTAVVLSSRRTRLERPAWIVIGAVIITAGLYQSPANFVIRNTALLVAAIDAAVTMVGLVWARRKVATS